MTAKTVYDPKAAENVPPWCTMNHDEVIASYKKWLDHYKPDRQNAEAEALEVRTLPNPTRSEVAEMFALYFAKNKWKNFDKDMYTRTESKDGMSPARSQVPGNQGAAKSRNEGRSQEKRSLYDVQISDSEWD